MGGALRKADHAKVAYHEKDSKVNLAFDCLYVALPDRLLGCGQLVGHTHANRLAAGSWFVSLLSGCGIDGLEPAVGNRSSAQNRRGDFSEASG
jgi:hypothetical protein